MKFLVRCFFKIIISYDLFRVT